jgi:tetraprenyl-beta-curcumene synthase
MRDEISWAVRHVLTSPTRLRFLLHEGPATPAHVLGFLRRIVPDARRQLDRIRHNALAIEDDALRAEALQSITAKAYHVAGGCILATFLPPQKAHSYVEIVAPLESIYDYLDNLCDRHAEVSAEAYPVLHQAIADALDPYAPVRDYYARGPNGHDSGYLVWLVTRVQQSLRELDGHEELLPYFREAAALYSEMQTYKHFPPGERERACREWFERRRDHRYAELEWYEFACAAGSQFQVYAPLFELFAQREASIGLTYDAYFPAAAALHVLLDSFIDQAEDREHGELNFAVAYGDSARMRERVAFLMQKAMKGFVALPDARRHRFVLRVMALFYLTHPKVYAQDLNVEAEALLQAIEKPCDHATV